MLLFYSINAKHYLHTDFHRIFLKCKSEKASGVEISVASEKHFLIVEKFIRLLHAERLLFQFHGTDFGTEGFDSYVHFYQNMFKKYPNSAGFPDKVTFHPVTQPTLRDSVKETKRALAAVQDADFLVCLENLNSIDGTLRLNVDNIVPLFCSTKPDLALCWDIGHQFFDGIAPEKVYGLMPHIKNVHFHHF